MTEPFITAPGVYDLDEATYHRDPVVGGSLSSTGARTLVQRTPAHFAYERDHGRPDRSAFDFGRAAHAEVLGVGAPIVEVDADSWRSKAAQAEATEARAAGATPLLVADAAKVRAMASALRAHPVVGPLLQPDHGTPEQVLVWRDEQFSVWRRAMLDWHTWLPDGRLCIVDYKTTVDASPDAFARSVAKYGYHQQDRWYCDGATATGLAGDLEPAFVFVCQEKDAPYVPAVHELGATDREWGRLDNRRALQLYRDCTRAGHWPGYSDDVIAITLPAWSTRQKEAAYDRGAYDLKDVPA